MDTRVFGFEYEKENSIEKMLSADIYLRWNVSKSVCSGPRHGGISRETEHVSYFSCFPLRDNSL